MGAGLRKLVCYETDDQGVSDGELNDQEFSRREGTEELSFGSPVTEDELRALFEELVTLSRSNAAAQSPPNERWFEQSSRIEQAVVLTHYWLTHYWLLLTTVLQHEAWHAELSRPVISGHRTELKMGADLATKIDAERSFGVCDENHDKHVDRKEWAKAMMMKRAALGEDQFREWFDKAVEAAHRIQSNNSREPDRTDQSTSTFYSHYRKQRKP